MEIEIKFEEFELEQQPLFVINETDVKFVTYKNEPEIFFQNEDFDIKSEENGKECLESTQYVKEENKSDTDGNAESSVTASVTPQNWVCCFCDFASTHKTDLSEHITAVHKDPANPNLFKCDRCNYTTQYLHKLTSHVTYHKSIENLQHKLPRPVAVKPKPEPPGDGPEQKCLICDFTYTNQKKVQEHILSMHKDPSDINMFKCKDCEFATQYFHKLARHTSGYSKPASPYNCEKCSYVTARWNCFRHHISKHEERHKCDKCPFETTVREFLEQHAATHVSEAEIPWRRCQMCEFKTTSKHRLNLHEMDHNSPDLEVYKCGLCKFRTRTKFYFRTHMRRHVKNSA